MGRKKLEIKARDTKEGKQVTFAKRRMGLEKKAQELATLCDIPLLLLLFSPNKRLSWISGSRGTPEEVLKSYAEIPFQERSRRKIEVLEQLNRAFKKSDHEINVENFSQLNTTTQNVKDLLTSLHDIRANLLQKLRECETPMTIEHASQIEQILRTRGHQIEMHKQLTEANQPMPSYNQILVEEKTLATSRHCMVPYDETSGQSSPWVAQDFGSIDATSQEAWETKCMPPIYEHEAATFIHDQEALSIKPSYLPSSCGASQYWLPNTMNPGVHHSTYLDHSCCQIDDTNKQNAIFGRDAQHNDAILPTKDSTSLWENHDFYDSKIRTPHDVPYYQPY